MSQYYTLHTSPMQQAKNINVKSCESKNPYARTALAEHNITSCHQH